MLLLHCLMKSYSFVMKITAKTPDYNEHCIISFAKEKTSLEREPFNNNTGIKRL